MINLPGIWLADSVVFGKYPARLPIFHFINLNTDKIETQRYITPAIAQDHRQY